MGFALTTHVPRDDVPSAFKDHLDVWEYVLRYSDSQRQCRAAVEFMAKWNPIKFLSVIESPRAAKFRGKDWLEVCVVSAQLRGGE